jgi:hypothetical protein
VLPHNNFYFIYITHMPITLKEAQALITTKQEQIMGNAIDFWENLIAAQQKESVKLAVKEDTDKADNLLSTI